MGRYHGLGYAGYHGLGYAGYGHGLGYYGGYYGKRSADAEPTAAAEAKAYPYYGYYGHGYHGLGYGLGYGRAYGYGLGYRGYGYGTATDTTVKYLDDSSQPKTSLGTTSSEKWIAQFGSIPTSATSFSATRLAQARNGEQEAKENQSVMIRRIKKSKPRK